MTAIAGCWRFDGSSGLQGPVSAMLERQRQYGPHGTAVAALEGVAFGRALYRLLPEDKFDAQPLIDGSGTHILVADLRIDNRDELLDRFQLPGSSPLSDSDLLLRAHLEWGEATPEQIIGDFAYALWNAGDRSLSLVRDTAGQRPLHYHLGKGFAAFSSMPEGLHALPEVPDELDEMVLAAFIADVPRSGSSTFYREIKRVEPGQVIKITPSGVATRSYWRFPDREIRFPKQSDYGEAVREQLDRATRVRLRGVDGVVGAHLSAGLDSGAVSSTAARLMAPGGGRVIAFTSAPRAGFAGESLRGRIGDESEIAATVPAMYPNMEHVIVRPEGVSPLDLLGRDASLFQEPVGHPCNFVWWSRVHDEAKARGLSVMLTGEAGNLTTSAGGLATLAQLIRAGRLLTWLREARKTVGTGPTWRGVLATSFGPWIPQPAWRGLVRMFGPPSRIDCATLVHPRFREQMKERAVEAARNARAERDDRKLRWRLLQQHEPGNFRKGILARWGVDERDPTADRRLADFCLAVPPEQLYGGGLNRRLARTAFADRLPEAVLHAPRGYQYPDWYEEIDRLRLERAIATLGQGPAASLVDTNGLRQLAETWPDADWNLVQNIGTYRLGLLMALSGGAFANNARQSAVQAEDGMELAGGDAAR